MTTRAKDNPSLFSIKSSSTPYYNIDIAETPETRAANYRRSTDILKQRGQLAITAILQDDYNSIVPGQPNTYEGYNDHRYGMELSPLYKPTTLYNYNTNTEKWVTDNTLFYPIGNKDSKPETIQTQVAIIGLSPIPAGFNADKVMSLAFGVNKDQSNVDNVANSDLLIGERDGLDKSSKEIELEMKHALAIVTFETNYTIKKNNESHNMVQIFMDSIATEGVFRLAGYQKYNASTSVKDCPLQIHLRKDTTFTKNKDYQDKIDTIVTDTYKKANDATLFPKSSVKLFEQDITSSDNLTLHRLTGIILPTNTPHIQFRIRIYGDDLYPKYVEGESICGTDATGNYKEYYLKPKRNTEKNIFEPGMRYSFSFTHGTYVPEQDPDEDITQ